MDYTESYVIYGIMFAIVIGIAVFAIYKMIKGEKNLNKKRNSKNEKDREEYAKFKKNDRRMKIWACVMLILLVGFYLIGVPKIPLIILVVILSEIITRIIEKFLK